MIVDVGAWQVVGGGGERGDLITDAAPTRVATYCQRGEDDMTPATA